MRHEAGQTYLHHMRHYGPVIDSGRAGAQSASRIYGYVSYGGVPASGATVTLAGPDSGQVNTTDSGYYEFAVSSGN